MEIVRDFSLDKADVWLIAAQPWNSRDFEAAVQFLHGPDLENCPAVLRRSCAATKGF